MSWPTIINGAEKAAQMAVRRRTARPAGIGDVPNRRDHSAAISGRPAGVVMSEPIVHTAPSASDAEVWLADLELDSGRPLSRVTWDEAGGGRVKVTVELGDLPQRPTGTGDNSGGAGQCAACGDPLPRQTGPGRRRRYCSDTCRYQHKPRRPRPPRCQMRAGAWRCTQQAEWAGRVGGPRGRVRRTAGGVGGRRLLRGGVRAVRRRVQGVRAAPTRRLERRAAACPGVAGRDRQQHRDG